MKVCSYCGRENGDEALSCIECGTSEFKGEKAMPETHPGPEFNFGTLSAEDTEKAWVTLLKCRTLPEADMIVSRLTAAGISAFIPDEFVMQAIGWNLNTYGYVRVQVSPKEYEAAKEFLSAPRTEYLNHGLR